MKPHGFGFQEVTRTGKRSLTQAPGPSARITMVQTQGLLEKLQSHCDGGFAAAPVEELARCVERNKNPRNAVPVGIIHHRGTAGSSQGLPQTPALSVCI